MFNLPLTGTFYVTHASRALLSHDLSIEGINCGTCIYFMTTQGHGGLHRWVISSMSGPPPRQREHRRPHTSFTLTFILTRRIWEGWSWWPNDIRGFVGPKVSRQCLRDEGKSNPGNLSRQGIEPGVAAWQTCMLPSALQWWTTISSAENAHLDEIGLSRRTINYLPIFLMQSSWSYIS